MAVGAEDRSSDMDIDFAPVGECIGDCDIAFGIALAEITQCFVRKYDAEPECIVGPIALIDSDFVARVGFAHENCEIHRHRFSERI